MSVKILLKDGRERNWDDSKSLLTQLENAEKVILDTRKDLGRKAETFLKRLVSLNAINIIKPFEIDIVKNQNLSEVKTNRMAKKVKKEMVLNWALKQTVECSNNCDLKISQMIDLVKGK